MSKLFELFVLGLLKDKYGNEVIYHYSNAGNELDFLLNNEKFKIVIDAKYKPYYESSFVNDDIRQISGYARLSSVYKILGISEKELIDCLIIYPNQNGVQNFLKDELLQVTPISKYVGIKKLGVKIPTI